jgi:hypothetical protein
VRGLDGIIEREERPWAKAHEGHMPVTCDAVTLEGLQSEFSGLAFRDAGTELGPDLAQDLPRLCLRSHHRFTREPWVHALKVLRRDGNRTDEVQKN